MPKVTVSAQVYNTREDYLRQFLESVLQQTFSDFEFLIVDNGSAESTSEILREYARQDSRIQMVCLKKNKAVARWIPVTIKMAKGEYLTSLDSDDWWEPNYLERMLSLAEGTDADIICTGTQMHVVGTNRSSLRVAPERLKIKRNDFAIAFSRYHVFLRPAWAKLFRAELYKKAIFPDYENQEVTYGGDTIFSFAMLRQANSMVLDNSVLHHYRIHSTSDSYKYNPRRFDSDVYLYNDAIDFLSGFGPISKENREFLSIVYANAVADTVNVISRAQLDAEGKLREYRRIVENPITQQNYQYNDEAVIRSRNNLLIAALNCHAARDGSAREDFRAVLNTLVPNCAPALSPENIPMLGGRKAIFDAVLHDDADTLLAQTMDMLRASEQTKKYDLAAMIRALSSDKPLLKDIDDKKFLRRHGDIYLAVWRGQYAEALDFMTGLLLNGEKVGETFLQLYLNLAALQNQPSAFVFGKIRLAQMYLRKGDKEACRAVLNELAEMGVEENNEILEIKNALN